MIEITLISTRQKKKHDNERTYDILKKSHVQTVNLEDDYLKFSNFKTVIKYDKHLQTILTAVCLFLTLTFEF